MYRFFLLAVWLSWLTPAASHAQSPTPPTDRPFKVLLIGNSLTYTNSLAARLTAFADATPQARPWRVVEQAMANAKLSQMWSMRTTEHLLKDEPWDYIVLQEHGVVPSQYPEGLISAARNFNTAARSVGAKVILSENYRASSQVETTTLFVRLGKELGAEVAPIGRAWLLVRERDPSIQLRETDGIHPSMIGQYLVGCVLYLTISGAEACPAVPNGSVSEPVSNVLREAAQQAVAKARANGGP